jgi:hypothetical protein
VVKYTGGVVEGAGAGANVGARTDGEVRLWKGGNVVIGPLPSGTTTSVARHPMSSTSTGRQTSKLTLNVSTAEQMVQSKHSLSKSTMKEQKGDPAGS